MSDAAEKNHNNDKATQPASTSQEANFKKRNISQQFVARDDRSLISQGAEARVLEIPKDTCALFDVDAIAKERFPSRIVIWSSMSV